MKNGTNPDIGKTKRRYYKSPKCLDDLKDGKGGLSEYGWGWLRTLAFGTRMKYWPDYPEFEDLEDAGLLRGVSMVLSLESSEVRNPRNLLMKGMRNAMRNQIYKRQEWDRRIAPAEGSLGSKEVFTLDNSETYSIEDEYDFIGEKRIEEEFGKEFSFFKGLSEDYDKYEEPLKRLCMEFFRTGQMYREEEVCVNEDIDERVLNRLLSVICSKLKERLC